MQCISCRGTYARNHGFSLVELAVAIAAISALLYFLLDRMLYMQEVAEKTEVEETISSINYGLRLEAASRLTRGSAQKQLSLEMENPVRWLSTRPRNYLGELAKPPEGAKPAYWYFNTQVKQLIYRPNRSEHLLIGGDKGKELQFTVGVQKGESQPKLQAQVGYLWFGEKND